MTAPWINYLYSRARGRYLPVEHYKGLAERHLHERDFFKAQLFETWKTMRGQTKGLQRLRRLIVRLRTERDALREAAGKVTCWECNDSGRMVNGLHAVPDEPEFIPCPYCGAIRALRALLERKS